MKEFRWRGLGRKKKSRINMAKAFVAKSIYKFQTTDIIIEYLMSERKVTIIPYSALARPAQKSIFKSQPESFTTQ